MSDQPTDSNLLHIPGHKDRRDSRHIIRLQADSNYTLLYMNDGADALLSSKTLKFFERQLPGFIRVSKSFLVNPGYVQKIVRPKAQMATVHLTDGVRIRVPSTRVRKVVDQLDRYELATRYWNTP